MAENKVVARTPLWEAWPAVPTAPFSPLDDSEEMYEDANKNVFGPGWLLSLGALVNVEITNVLKIYDSLTEAKINEEKKIFFIHGGTVVAYKIRSAKAIQLIGPPIEALKKQMGFNEKAEEGKFKREKVSPQTSEAVQKLHLYAALALKGKNTPNFFPYGSGLKGVVAYHECSGENCNHDTLRL